MKIIITKDYRSMSARAARIVIRQIQKKPGSVLGLATGDTPLGLYQNLLAAYKQGKISFKKVTTFNLDEYVALAKNNKNSYYHYMQRNLFKYINIDKKNIFIPNGQAEDFKKECQNYERMIKKSKGIDLLILGIGIDGHIGFNEPGSSFNSGIHVVNLTSSTRRVNAEHFKSLKEVPKKAITMGLATIMQAKKILLLASGKDKADIIAMAFKGKITKQVPASILQRHHNLTVILDKKTASNLLAYQNNF
ncbi:MAG: glucosamine-6-phosphate deaminase [Patescibacteria group bacterium]